MKGKRVDKLIALVALPFLVQIAVVCALYWGHFLDLNTQRAAAARYAVASQVEQSAKSLKSIIEKHPDGFVPAARTMVENLQTLAASTYIKDSFDQQDYPVAIGDLNDIEALTAKEQVWTASSYRPHLLEFAQDQVNRATGVMEKARQEQNSISLFLSLALIGTAINAAALFWFIKMNNKAAASRLDIIRDNTERLQHGMTLNTMFSGTDGFAQLDKRFHDMADALEKANERLRKGEARFRLVLENMPVGVMLATTQGVIESANPKACEVLACGPARLTGKPISNFFSLPEGESLESIATHERTVLMKAKKDDSTTFSAEMLVSRYRDDDGEKLLVSFEDVTWRIELERMKREFMAMISHDIRTPLTSISATLGMLSAGGYGQLPDEARGRIEKDEDSLEHLMRLLNDLLSIEKIASSSFTLQKAPTSTAKIVERALAVVAPTARSRKIDVSVVGSHCRLSADEDRMVQVLTNLLTNAVKFSPAGSTVTIGIESAGANLQLKVSDVGTGIALADQEKIFESFGQLQSRDFAGVKGMGLGLAICKKIVEQHGGRIGVSSEPGKGTTFWVTIPKPAETAGTAAEAAGTGGAAGTAEAAEAGAEAAGTAEAAAEAAGTAEAAAEAAGTAEAAAEAADSGQVIDMTLKIPKG